MDTPMYEALEGSIAKWENIILNKGMDRGFCTLCKLRDKRQSNCEGCVITCTAPGGTYMAWKNHHIHTHGIMTHPLHIVQACGKCYELALTHRIYLKRSLEDMVGQGEVEVLGMDEGSYVPSSIPDQGGSKK